MLPEPSSTWARFSSVTVTGHPRRTEEGLERPGVRVGRGLVAAEVLGQRHIYEVDHVDVEMNQHAIRAILEQLQGAFRRRRRVGGDLGGRDDVVDCRSIAFGSCSVACTGSHPNSTTCSASSRGP